MAERKPAPGRVVTTARNAWHSWQCHACGEDRKSLPCYRAFLDVGKAADALREHLRTEHAELWEPCWLCDGLGYREGKPGRQVTLRLGCPACNGRGYVERHPQDSHAARQDASSTPDGSKGAGSENGAQIAGNACGDRLGTWHGPIGPCVRTGRHTLHDDGAGITWSRSNVPDLTGEPS